MASHTDQNDFYYTQVPGFSGIGRTREGTRFRITFVLYAKKIIIRWVCQCAKYQDWFKSCIKAIIVLKFHPHCPIKIDHRIWCIILTNVGPMPKWSNHLTNVVLCKFTMISKNLVVFESNCTEKDYFWCVDMTKNNDKKI
jgi:hypothetical protein